MGFDDPIVDESVESVWQFQRYDGGFHGPRFWEEDQRSCIGATLWVTRGLLSLGLEKDAIESAIDFVEAEEIEDSPYQFSNSALTLETLHLYGCESENECVKRHMDYLLSLKDGEGKWRCASDPDQRARNRAVVFLILDAIRKLRPEILTNCEFDFLHSRSPQVHLCCTDREARHSTRDAGEKGAGIHHLGRAVSQLGAIRRKKMTWLITPKQTLSAARQAGLDDEHLQLSGVAVLTFSKAVLDRLEELCGHKDAAWLVPQHHPYAAARIVKRGEFDGLGVTVLVPPMGASPLACVVEDLAACGVQAVFLVCAAWSLGPPVRFGDLIVPAFSIGPDGTSIHYGNSKGEVRTALEFVDALVEACRVLDARHHIGGNATCEALYRITPVMADDFRERGCLCVDNGEASTLFAVTHTLGILGGVLFQPYIELTQGWDPALLRDERYRDTCRLQAEVVLEASTQLRRQGSLD